jgi:hypothetical protein
MSRFTSSGLVVEVGAGAGSVVVVVGGTDVVVEDGGAVVAVVCAAAVVVVLSGSLLEVVGAGGAVVVVVRPAVPDVVAFLCGAEVQADRVTRIAQAPSPDRTARRRRRVTSAEMFTACGKSRLDSRYELARRSGGQLDGHPALRTLFVVGEVDVQGVLVGRVIRVVVVDGGMGELKPARGTFSAPGDVRSLCHI